MVKAIVLSDIHGYTKNVYSVLDKHADAEYVIFLGDGVRELQKIVDFYPRIGFIAVTGNCDLGFFGFIPTDEPDKKVVCLENYRIFMTHGHRYNVKSDKNSLSLLFYTANNEKADIVLFGHTHVPFKEERTNSLGKNVTLFNPGSISSPRGGSDYSYGIIEFYKDHYIIKHEKVES